MNEEPDFAGFVLHGPAGEAIWARRWAPLPTARPVASVTDQPAEGLAGGWSGWWSDRHNTSQANRPSGRLEPSGSGPPRDLQTTRPEPVFLTVARPPMGRLRLVAAWHVGTADIRSRWVGGDSGLLFCSGRLDCSRTVDFWSRLDQRLQEVEPLGDSRATSSRRTTSGAPPPPPLGGVAVSKKWAAPCGRLLRGADFFI